MIMGIPYVTFFSKARDELLLILNTSQFDSILERVGEGRGGGVVDKYINNDNKWNIRWNMKHNLSS